VTVGGRSLLAWSLEPLRRLEQLGVVVLVVPGERIAEAEALARDVLSWGEPPGGPELRVVAGAASRQGSVAAGLAALPAEGDRIVLVHDAARAFTPSEQFATVARAVRESGAGVLPALPVIDSVKRVSPAGAVLASVERSELAAAQTPQGFPAGALRAAYAAATSEHTDDAAVFAAAGHAVRRVPGHPRALKITTPDDLETARRWLSEPAPRGASTQARTGVGVDVHAFAEGRPLWLAGLRWEGSRGLAGHSDGDVVSHAIADAVLSALGKGDLGSVLGTEDPALAGAHGEAILSRVRALVEQEGRSVAHVAVQLLSSEPRLAPRREEAEACLSSWVGGPVSLGATTTDGLGFPGRGEGALALAVATLL